MGKLITKLHLACSRDELKPAINHIYFDQGYMIATEGHLLVRQKLSLHDFTADEIAFTQGKMIHRDIFKNLQKEKALEITEEGFSVSKSNSSILYKWSDETSKFPDYNAVIPLEGNETEVDRVGIDLSNVHQAMDCLIYNTPRTIVMDFYGKTEGIVIIPTGSSREDQLLLLMPLALAAL